MVPGDRGGRARVGLEGTGGRNYKVAGGISGGDLLIILTVVMVSWVHNICPNISNVHFKYV